MEVNDYTSFFGLNRLLKINDIKDALNQVITKASEKYRYQIYNLNVKDLLSLLNEAYYKIDVMILTQLVANAIIHFSPNLDVNDLLIRNVLRPSSPMYNETIVIHGFRGEPGVFAIKNKETISGLITDFLIGVLGLNPLRQEIPNFIFTYGIFKCSRPMIRDDKLIDWCYDYNNIPYLMIESINPPLQLSHVMRGIDISLFLNLYCQVILAIQLANERMSFCHNDLHEGNILVRDTPYSKYYYLCYKLKNTTYYLYTNKIATIIDFEFSSIKLNNIRIGQDSEDLYYDIKFFVNATDKNSTKINEVINRIKSIFPERGGDKNIILKILDHLMNERMVDFITTMYPSNAPILQDVSSTSTTTGSLVDRIALMEEWLGLDQQLVANNIVQLYELRNVSNNKVIINFNIREQIERLVREMAITRDGIKQNLTKLGVSLETFFNSITVNQIIQSLEMGNGLDVNIRLLRKIVDITEFTTNLIYKYRDIIEICNFSLKKYELASGHDNSYLTYLSDLKNTILTYIPLSSLEKIKNVYIPSYLSSHEIVKEYIVKLSKYVT
jgi:hypothetical protein